MTDFKAEPPRSGPQHRLVDPPESVDGTRASGRSRSELDAERVARVFRQLAREHLAERRRDDPESIWQQVAARANLNSGQLELRHAARTRAPAGPRTHATPARRAWGRGWNRSWGGSWLPIVAAAALVAVVGFGTSWIGSDGVSQGASAQGASSQGASPRDVSSKDDSADRLGALSTGGGSSYGGGLSYVVKSEDGSAMALAPADVAEGRLLATEALEATVQFSDGSSVVLQPHTTLRVRVDGERVVARVAQGKIAVSVEHRDRTDYRFHSGPYEVRVVGTQFDLAYDPATLRMNLDLHEGKVLVTDEAGTSRQVREGQSLELPRLGELANLEDLPQEGDVGEEDAGPDSGPAAPGSPQAQTLQGRSLQGRSLQGRTLQGRTPQSQGARDGAGRAVDYRQLAREGRFAEIVEDAQAAGLSRTLSARSAADLQELAQAARYTGRSQLAVQVFEHLTRTYPGSAPGRSASFFLGRIAEERGQAGKALGLYGGYLSENPGGLYAAEALGRKMALIHKSQSAAAARSVAEQYLRRFPNGAYHSLAQSLVRQAGSQGE